MVDAIKPVTVFLAAAIVYGELCLAASNARADPVGHVLAVQGVASVQRGGGAFLVGGGSPLEAGDVLTTGSKAEALVRMADGTRLTLGSESQFALIEPLVNAPPDGTDAAAPRRFRLLKGSVRLTNGARSRRVATSKADSAPDGESNSSQAARHVEVQTPVATVALAQGEAELRLCDDCEGSAHASQVARVVQIAGIVQAIDSGGSSRRLVNGSVLHPSDVVATNEGAYVVMVFLDDTRMALEAQTRVRLAVFRYEPIAPAKGQVVIDLIKGGLRELTGLIGQFDHHHVEVRTAAATIGVRGTGFDLRCLGSCADDATAPAPDDGLAATVWKGAIVLNPLDVGGAPCATASELAEGESAQIRSCNEGVQPMNAPLHFAAPRPDLVDIDPPKGSNASLSSDAATVWVRVREGQAVLDTGQGTPLVLDEGETGYAGSSGAGIAEATAAKVAMPPLTSPDSAPSDLATLLTQWQSAQCRP